MSDIETKKAKLLGDVETGSRNNSVSSIKSGFSSNSELPQNSSYLTTFLLINTMIGSGILNQPYVFSQSGIVGGIFGFVLASSSTWLGLVFLTASGLEVNAMEYGRLAFLAFGKAGETLIDAAIVINSFGSQLGYILIVGDTLSSLLSSWGCNSIGCTHNITTVVAVAMFVTPVCLLRHFGHLAFLSLFSVTTIVLVLGLVIVGGPIKNVTNGNNGAVSIFDVAGSVRSTGSIVFAVTCASANFHAFVTTEKQSRSLDKWYGITGWAVFIGSSMCMCMGIAGYLSFGSKTDGDILNNFVAPGFDFFKIMVVIHLILYIPVNFVIMRYSIVKIAIDKRSETLPFVTHTVLSLFLLAITTGVVIILRSYGLASGSAFSLILNITGGIGGSLSAIILPAAIFLKVMPRDTYMYQVAKIVLAFGILVMVAVLAETSISLSKS